MSDQMLTRGEAFFLGLCYACTWVELAGREVVTPGSGMCRDFDEGQNSTTTKTILTFITSQVLNYKIRRGSQMNILHGLKYA